MIKCKKKMCIHNIAYLCIKKGAADNELGSVCGYSCLEENIVDNNFESNPKIKYLYDPRSGYLHDKTCHRVNIHRNDYKYYEILPRGRKQCMDCKLRMILRTGHASDEEIYQLEKIFESNEVNENLLYDVFIRRKGSLHFLKNVIHVRLNNDDWEIHLIHGGVLLKHNNYHSLCDGKRERRKGYHDQLKGNAVTIGLALNYIRGYNYNRSTHNNWQVKKETEAEMEELCL